MWASNRSINPDKLDFWDQNVLFSQGGDGSKPDSFTFLTSPLLYQIMSWLFCGIFIVFLLLFLVSLESAVGSQSIQTSVPFCLFVMLQPDDTTFKCICVLSLFYTLEPMTSAEIQPRKKVAFKRGFKSRQWRGLSEMEEGFFPQFRSWFSERKTPLPPSLREWVGLKGSSSKGQIKMQQMLFKIKRLSRSAPS